VGRGSGAGGANRLGWGLVRFVSSMVVPLRTRGNDSLLVALPLFNGQHHGAAKWCGGAMEDLGAGASWQSGQMGVIPLMAGLAGAPSDPGMVPRRLTEPGLGKSIFVSIILTIRFNKKVSQ
jgi:hypothetical protein